MPHDQPRTDAGRPIRPAPKLDAIGTASNRVFLKTVLPTRCLPLPERRDVDEYLYVLHGELDVWLDERHTGLRAGGSIALPSGTVYRVGNFSSRPAKVLIVATHDQAPRSVRVRPSGRGAAGRVAAVLTPGDVDVVLE